MKLRWCGVLVKDLDESIKFYREVIGLPEPKRASAGPGTEIALFDTGGAELELLQKYDVPNPDPGNAVCIAFEVASIEDAMAHVTEKGIEIERGPIISPRAKFFFIRDPNGVEVELKQAD